MDTRKVRDVLGALQGPLRTKAGAKAFIEGPTNIPASVLPPGMMAPPLGTVPPEALAEMGGLRWAANKLITLAKLESEGVHEEGPFHVFGLCLTQTFCDMLGLRGVGREGPAASALQLLSMPWGQQDRHAPTGILQPLIRLLGLRAERRSAFAPGRHPESDWPGVHHFTMNTLQLLGGMAKDQRAGDKIVQAGALKPLLQILRETTMALRKSDPGDASAVSSAQESTQVATALQCLVQDTPSVKRKFIEAGVVPTVVAALAAAVGALEEGEWMIDGHPVLRPAAETAKLLAVLINNLSVGSQEVKAAFRAEGSAVATALARAMTLPPHLGARPGSEPSAVARAACQAVGSLALDPAMRAEFVAAGVVARLVDIGRHKPFATGPGAIKMLGSSLGPDEPAQLFEDNLVYGATLALCALGGQSDPTPADRAAIAPAKEVVRALMGRPHSEELLVHLETLASILGLPPTAGPAPPAPGLEGSMCAVTTVQATGSVIMDKSVGTTNYMPFPLSQEEREAAKDAKRSAGDLDGARKLAGEDAIIARVLSDLRKGNLEWKISQVEIPRKYVGASWEGYRKGSGPPGRPAVVVTEYSIAGQVGTSGEPFPPGAMGYDALVPDERHGMVMMPREAARALLLAAKEAAGGGSAQPARHVADASGSEPLTARVGKLKQVGNDQFRAGDMDGAARSYEEALNMLLVVIKAGPVKAGVRELAVTLLSNRAQCQLNRKRFQGALSDCRRATQFIDQEAAAGGGMPTPLRAKVAYRLAAARESLGDAAGAAGGLRAAHAAGLGTPAGEEMLARLEMAAASLA